MRWYIADKTGSEMARIGSFGDDISWVCAQRGQPRQSGRIYNLSTLTSRRNSDMLNGEDSPAALAIEILRQALEQWSSDENLYLVPKILWSNMTKKPANAHEKWQAPFPTIDVIEQASQNSQIYPYIYLVENEFLSCHKQPHQLDEIWLLGEDSNVSEEVARILNTGGLNVRISKPYDIMCWGLSGQQKDIVLL